MSDEALHNYQRYFVDVLPALQGYHNMQVMADARLALLAAEINHRRTEKHTNRHHQQVMKRAGWTLFWAAIGGIGTIALVLLETPLSRLFTGTSKSPQPSGAMLSSATPSSVQSAPVSPTVSTPPSETEKTPK